MALKKYRFTKTTNTQNYYYCFHYLIESMQTEATQATCDTDKMPVVSLLVSVMMYGGHLTMILHTVSNSTFQLVDAINGKDPSMAAIIALGWSNARNRFQRCAPISVPSVVFVL